MLIVNADDWGRCPAATDNSLECYRKGRITSASAMVFMADSARSADLAIAAGIDIGLHINLSEQFSGEGVPNEVRDAQNRIRRFLHLNKYALIIYHPLLRRHFATVFETQLREFYRLFGKAPSHMDGHQHFHLSSNMLLQKIIPEGVKVRRSFSFQPGERSFFNRAYRSWVDRKILQRHRTTDFFFALPSDRSVSRLEPILALARDRVLELMTHPQLPEDNDWLLSREYGEAIKSVPLGDYSSLS